MILEDNTIEWQLDEAQEHRVVTESVRNALVLDSLPLIEEAGMSDQVFLGVIANSPRLPEALAYVNYILTAGS